MSNNKSKKRVYSKPTKVVKPVEEKIEEITEKVIEAKAIDPEVFETKLFVEEEPEEIKIEQHIEGEKFAEVLEANHNIDAVAELEKVLQCEGADQLGVDAQAEIKTLSEESTGLVYGDDYHEDPNVEKTLVDKSPSTAIFGLENPEPTYTLTPEQEEEGAKVVAEMVEEQILAELKEKALAPEPPTQKTIASLSNAELRHFRRTGQMPR